MSNSKSRYFCYRSDDGDDDEEEDKSSTITPINGTSTTTRKPSAIYKPKKTPSDPQPKAYFLLPMMTTRPKHHSLALPPNLHLRDYPNQRTSLPHRKTELPLTLLRPPFLPMSSPKSAPTQKKPS
ncbi:unnamed protein product [Fraxinus pennsylvanica]|uniref:Uncharacterized protein n=1 Tax=Fraxinus pennsylvanica TaxID=56036 RepID=A0AAD1ZMS1_9LAMI|nr:unnamed protein product [Fraxinus pennsylvanica]